MSSDIPSLAVHPIGFIRTEMRTKFDTPHQPVDSADQQSRIELNAGHNYEKGLKDLEGFERIWVVSWFHRNTTWKPTVLPPRGEAQRRGVFATRSPHRPNPIGLTCVRLIAIDGRTLTIGNHDLVDGTPVLDIKPYLSTVDAFPDSSIGWLADVEAALSTPPRYIVSLSALAEEQRGFLQREWAVDFIPRVTELLSRDPRPHRTRRIAKRQDGTFRIGCGAWRAVFSVDGTNVCITELKRGYPERLLLSDEHERVPDREAQLAFGKRWPEG